MLAQLARFSGNREASLLRDNEGRADPVAMAYAQGKRDFFEMIRLHLAMDDADLYNYERQERQVKSNE